jgi:hypothetical protein
MASDADPIPLHTISENTISIIKLDLLSCMNLYRFSGKQNITRKTRYPKIYKRCCEKPESDTLAREALPEHAIYNFTTYYLSSLANDGRN